MNWKRVEGMFIWKLCTHSCYQCESNAIHYLKRFSEWTIEEMLIGQRQTSNNSDPPSFNQFSTSFPSLGFPCDSSRCSVVTQMIHSNAIVFIVICMLLALRAVVVLGRAPSSRQMLRLHQLLHEIIDSHSQFWVHSMPMKAHWSHQMLWTSFAHVGTGPASTLPIRSSSQHQFVID